jgi:hypothetical protein
MYCLKYPQGNAMILAPPQKKTSEKGQKESLKGRKFLATGRSSEQMMVSRAYRSPEMHPPGILRSQAMYYIVESA